jgi:hypothetical protein
MRLSGILAAAAVFFAGCDIGNQQLPVIVAVYPGAQNCTVKIDNSETPIACAELGAHLRDQLKVAAERQIDVSMFRMDKSHSEKDIDAVAAVIRAAGFEDVKVWRFGLE